MAKKSHQDRQAVIYLRVARVQEGSSQAVTAQREACQRIAERHGLAVIREYADLGRPARLEEQPELHNLLSSLAVRRDAAYVIVWDYTRLSRDLATLNEVIDQLRAYGVQVVTLTGVEVAERFIQSGGILGASFESSDRDTTSGLFSLALIKAIFEGLSDHQSLAVTALLPNGETTSGTVTGIGSRLGVQTKDGKLIEDVRAEWIVRCTTQTNE